MTEPASHKPAESPESFDIPFCDAPCGHSSQYTYTEDGGKTMECLVCEVKRLRASSPEIPRQTLDARFLETERNNHRVSIMEWEKCEAELEKHSKLLADTRQFLVDAQLSFVDQIRKIDALIGDMPKGEKEISIAPFGLDNDHL